MRDRFRSRLLFYPMRFSGAGAVMILHNPRDALMEKAVKIRLLIVALILSSNCAAAPPLQVETLMDGKLSLLLPTNFAPLSAERLARKYPRQQPPQLAYSNPETTVNVAVAHTPHPVPPEQLAAAYSHPERGVKSSVPTAKWYQSRMTTINGRAFFLMEFQSPAADVAVRNIMVGTSLDGRLLIVSFNTTEPLEKEWMPVGRKIIQSIEVR